jgi:PAS domain S-box-containing protein
VHQDADLMQAVLNGTTDVIFVKDLSGKYVFINRIGAYFIGKSIKEVIGLYDHELYDSQDLIEIRATEDKVVKLGISITFEQSGAPLAAGHTFLVTKSPFRSANGDILGVIGIARDISPQKRAAEVLSESAERFRTLAANSPTGIYEADVRGQFIYFNNRCCELFEMSREQLQRDRGWNVIHPDDVARVAEGWQRFQSNDEKYLSVEFRLLFPQLRIKHVVATSLPLFDASGVKTGYIGNLVEVTEQRQAQLELQRANQELEIRVQQRTSELLFANEKLRQEMTERLRTEERLREQQAQLAHAMRVRTLGEMAAGLAHEVNQPLAAISHYVHGTLLRLEANLLTLPEVGSTLEFIARESERAADVIRRTKRFASTQPPSRSPLNLHVLIHESLEMLAPKIREHQIQVELQFAEALPEATGDELQVQQVIVNLLHNAIEAASDTAFSHKSVRLSTTFDEKWVEFEVNDSGPGLKSGQPERIFEPFQTTKSDGLGLGLSISRTIIEAHGGRLWTVVPCEQGATFRFSLPLWKDESDARNTAYADHLRRG